MSAVCLLIFIAIYFLQLENASLMYSGPRFKVYDPDINSLFYINDHTFILGTKWHIIGITHTNPDNPDYEVNLGHAASNLTILSNASKYFTQEPFVLGAKAPETHLWSPHILDVTDYGYTCYNQTNTGYTINKRCYYMVYCGGSQNNSHIRSAYSTDLYQWKRLGTLFIDGVNARDPMLFYDEQTNFWNLYYTATRPNDPNAPNINHVNLMRQSNNLFDVNSWSNTSYLVFNGGPNGPYGPYGGMTESPFVLRRGVNYYLCNGPWYNYTTTRCWYSSSSFNFGSILDNTAIEAGSFGNLHAAEIVRDSNGVWFISGAGWNESGVYLSELYFNDDQDNRSTSMNIPTPIKIPDQFTFDTNLEFYVNHPNDDYNSYSYWNMLPSFSNKIFGGNPMNNTFLMTTNLSTDFNDGLNWECNVIFNLLTSDGNPGPNNYPQQLLRNGSAVSIVFGMNSYNNTNVINHTAITAFGVNLFLNNHLNNGGGITFFKFNPFKQYVIVDDTDLDNDIWYELKIQFNDQNKYLNVYLNNTRSIDNYTITFDNSLLNGYVGLNVWQGSAVFDQFMCQ